VIAGIDRSVVLQSDRIAAGFRKNTQTSWLADPFGKADFENLNVCFADIFADPSIEDRREEGSVVQ